MKRAPAPGVLPVIAIDRAAQAPLHRQIYEGYREAIVERRLRAGQRLPSTRALAVELGVSRLPVLVAFEQLLAEGFVVGRVGAGTFVAGEPPTKAGPRAGPDGRIRSPGPRRVSQASERLEGAVLTSSGRGAFRLSEPALEQFPFRQWGRLVARHGKSPTRALLAYGDPLGLPALREALAAYLRTSRGVRCEPEQVMVVSGSQQALDLCIRTLVDPGNTVWLEEPGYAGARNAFSAAGARVVAVPVDEEGLSVTAGVERAPAARAVYVTPSHQYPLGATMTGARRLQLLEWAERAGAWVLEDDYDSEYRFEGPPVSALQGLDRDGRVLYLGTFSKVLFPGLRMGYLVLPRDLVGRFTALRDTLDIFPAPFHQAVLADFISEGHFSRHLRGMRNLYRERRTALVQALTAELGDSARVVGEHAGMHLVLSLPRGMDDRAIASRAAAEGLWVTPLSSCYLGRPTRAGLVLGFGGTPAEGMREAVRRLVPLLPPTRGRRAAAPTTPG